MTLVVPRQTQMDRLVSRIVDCFKEDLKYGLLTQVKERRPAADGGDGPVTLFRHYFELNHEVGQVFRHNDGTLPDSLSYRSFCAFSGEKKLRDALGERLGCRVAWVPCGKTNEGLGIECTLYDLRMPDDLDEFRRCHRAASGGVVLLACYLSLPEEVILDTIIQVCKRHLDSKSVAYRTYLNDYGWCGVHISLQNHINVTNADAVRKLVDGHAFRDAISWFTGCTINQLSTSNVYADHGEELSIRFALTP